MYKYKHLYTIKKNSIKPFRKYTPSTKKKVEVSIPKKGEIKKWEHISVMKSD